MNYIKQLEKTVREQRAEIEALRNGAVRVIAYVNSAKFFSGDSLDGYVNVNDVTVRLREVLSTEVA